MSFFLLLLLIVSGAVQAAPPVLELPVRCTLGKDCFIQQYVDRDPGPGARDYQCGSLSYDGHKGTDFRVANIAAMQAGVPVVAAAAGVVVGVRDGEPDVALRDRTEPLRADRMAGNAVRIDHGDGWTTQYSHMKRGSVRVNRGQHVAAGEMLGLIGLSGNTEFPHVDLEVSHDGITVDPFAKDSTDRCGDPEGSLWSPQATQHLRYQVTGLLGAGFAPFMPTQEWVQEGAATAVTPAAEVLCFWREIFGLREGDRLEMELRGPSGEVLARNVRLADRNRATDFAYIGKKRPGERWPTGKYAGSFKLLRGATTVLDESRTVVMPLSAGSSLKNSFGF